MKNALGTIMAAAGCIATAAYGDALLTYELTRPGAEARVQKVAIARFFARVEDSTKPDTYLLFQGGKFVPLFEVNPSQKTYRQLTPEVKPTLHAGSTGAAAKPATATATSEQNRSGLPGPAASASAAKTAEQTAAATGGETSKKPEATTPEPTSTGEMSPAPAGPTAGAQADQAEANPAVEGSGKTPRSSAAQPKAKPKLKATWDKREVAGIECRVVEEIEDGKPVIEHCMANKARLGITERETRTLARLFAMARDRGYGWLAVGTGDEEFVSIQARDMADGSELILKSVSTEPLPAGYLRISPEFKQTKP